MRFDDQPIPKPRLDDMLAQLKPRGPDGHGVEPLGRCGLVHTRLSVVDLMGGHQPMSVPAVNSQGRLTLIFNGEIYNHRALRRQLEVLGHQFTTSHCDTEVLLHGYRQWGDQMPKHLHGMFAFAIWDADRRRLLLVRDRAGKKPLYAYRTDNQLVFASLLGAAITGADEPVDISGQALSEYLTFGYTFHESIFRRVWEVPAGHWMTFDPDGRTEMQRYWRPPPLSRSSTKLGAIEAADELLTEAVATRLEADVPLGCFLSGGIDSSLIAAMAQKQLPSGERLQTFCVAMPDGKYDESPYARMVADHIGAEHHVLRAEANVEDDLKHLTATVGEPFADSSILPTYWLSKATREHVVVALSGDGGDELFGGYDRYRAMRLLQRHRWWLRSVPLGLLGSNEQKSLATRVRRLASSARQSDQSRQYLDMVRLFSARQLGELGLRDVVSIPAPPDWEAEVDPAEAARRWDLFHYLPFDLLRKVDRASMAVALEVRCPMLDTQLCDFAFHVPLRVLAPHGRPKWLLRRVAAKYLPTSIIQRRKAGFALPIGKWFRDDLAAMLSRYLLEGRLGELGARRDVIERYITEHRDGGYDHSHRLYALLSLSMWLEWVHEVTPSASFV